ncbi:hypothetical protein K9N68_31880 [Kovacikia minuta CCNUW1]|uniref:hypothetical protein n=1 Tax=Kovacikia minuta TaxID=2931930 RepID=UPI001CCC78FF|nr:hypothetical protein K9N68_31880 [Kovacikia minuta CCNUW1]
MAYICELGMGQRVYVDNKGGQTMVTVASSSAGQQQQSSSWFSDGYLDSPT